MHEDLVDEASELLTKTSNKNSENPKNTLAIFNLDFTIFEIDVGWSWVNFLIEGNHIDFRGCGDRNDYYCELKSRGELDPAEYAMYLAGIYNRLGNKKEPLIKDFAQKVVMPNLRPKALAALKAHEMLGHTPAFTSDSESSIVDECHSRISLEAYSWGGLSFTISTELQQDQNGYTGDIDGLANYLEGKVEGLKEGFRELSCCGIKPDFVYVYSNSFNDLPLLEFADAAYAVTPDARLRAEAESRGWAILDWSMSA